MQSFIHYYNKCNESNTNPFTRSQSHPQKRGKFTPLNQINKKCVSFNVELQYIKKRDKKWPSASRTHRLKVPYPH